MNPEGFADALPAGAHVGPVVLERAIGQGAWGIVYEGHHDNWGRVAVKEFFPSAYARRTMSKGVGASAPQWQDAVRKGLARFTAEGEALRSIRYEHVVPVLDFIEQDGAAFLVMEFIEGETLGAAMEAGRFRDPASVMTLATALVGTLGAIHAKNILHRDIAPDNIMIRSDGTPVLIDFGGAAAAVANATRSTQNIVKDGYSPPEQYDATNAAFPVGPWSDIYATAAVLYRLVSGQEPPVSNTRLMAAGARGQTDPLAPLRTRQPAANYSARWLAAVDAALALLPEDRPQSAAAWQGLFLGESLRGPQPRTWWPIAVAGVAVLVAIGAFIVVRDQPKITPVQNVAAVTARTPAPRAAPTTRPTRRPEPKQTARPTPRPTLAPTTAPKVAVPSAPPTSRVVYVQATPRVVYVPAPAAAPAAVVPIVTPAAVTPVAQATIDPVVGSWIFGSRYSWDFAAGGYVQARNPDGSPQDGGRWSRSGDQITASFENGYSYVFTVTAGATSFSALDNHGTRQAATKLR